MKYYLRESNLPHTQGYKNEARILMTQECTLDDLCKEIALKNSSYSYEELLTLSHKLFDLVLEKSCKGTKVKLPLFHTHFSIKGTFDTSRDCFDRCRHQLMFHFVPSSMVRSRTEKICLEKVEHKELGIYIADVYDASTESYNQVLTPNSSIIVYGHNLKVVGEDESVGFYFLNEAQKQSIKAKLIAKNSYRELFVMTPNLSAGEWKFVIYSQYSRSHKVRQRVRMGKSLFAMEVL